MELKKSNKSKDMNTIILYHQNIRSITNKIDELSIIMQKNCIGPHFVCLTEHHLNETEITKLSLEGFKLASEFCRKKSLEEGLCILINKNLFYHSMDLNHFCQEKTLEICAVKLIFKSLKLIIFCIYRAPTGKLSHFLKLLENILNHFLQPNVTFLNFGDLNINLLAKSNAASKLLTLMNTYNLSQVVDFPTRITNKDGTLIDTIFVDTSIYDKIQIKPFINGLSDYDAQIICLHKTNVTPQQKFPKRKSRLINEQTIRYFQLLLKEESWNQIYTSSCTNEIFNKLHDIFLRYYEASFPVVYTNCRQVQNNWITQGIRISRTKKRELFLRYRENKENIQLKNHYKKYCQILKMVINEAKKQFFINK
jgi:hypothetical protein